MKQQISYKNFFINYIIFVLIVAFVFGVLIYVSKISQKKWEKNLRTVVENTLGETQPDTWEVGKSVKIDNPITLSAACYEAKNKKSGEQSLVFIIRVQTFYGPQSAVFIYSNDVVTFAGYSSIHGRIRNQLMNAKTGNHIEYWKKRIMLFVNESKR